MLEQIKQALENATPDWHDNGNEIVSKQNLRVGIGGFLKDEDNHLAANAPEWLRYLIDEVEQLKEREFNHYPITILALESRIDGLQKALKQWEDFANHLNNITSCSMTKNEIRQALNTFAGRSESK
jgi:thioesterase domain-containing protein